MTIQTSNLDRILRTLEASVEALRQEEAGSLTFEIYRNAVIKGFELSLELCGKLLRKVLKEFEANPRDVDGLPYKEVFRRCAKHQVLDLELVSRWFTYRDNRNNTAHDYGIAFAEDTLALLPHFLEDAYTIKRMIDDRFSE
jgi:uncharacterized protein YutE (UPF0331/DUF86 family)